MKTSKNRRLCPACRKSTNQVDKAGNLIGLGADAYQPVESRCLACGHVVKGKRYPNLLAHIFSVPTTTK